ncbi:replication-associated protein RepX [Lactococcus formosensis]|uniref:replication-associated protein RepX n=1 Tax=Lactococcus formosensis TaxID=1281486 RepID=UPI0024356883|nr:replication-associated protein RepX [Lactococcus formosensis]MDG6143936.1 replication-associated protein RepX [Lactococcus formosensis]
MSENLKTIKELADELGVSKTYIEKIIRVVNIHSELLKKKNRFFLNIKQQEIIKNYLDKPPTQAPTADKEPPTQAPTADKEPPTQAPTADKEPPTQAPTADKEPPTQAPTADKEPPTQAPTADKEPPTQAPTADKEPPTADVVFLQNELVKRGVEIDKLHELLDQQQRLALQDKKLLDEYKSEINDLKALKMPSQETEFKHLDNQYKDEVNVLKEKLENLQEQIKVQKRIEEQEKPRKWWGLWRK